MAGMVEELRQRQQKNKGKDGEVAKVRIAE